MNLSRTDHNVADPSPPSDHNNNRVVVGEVDFFSDRNKSSSPALDDRDHPQHVKNKISRDGSPPKFNLDVNVSFPFSLI